VPLLEEFNPGEVEEIHAVFVGGSHMPVRVRCFVDYLVENSHLLGTGRAVRLEPAVQMPDV
jgi:hypothetical protein